MPIKTEKREKIGKKRSQSASLMFVLVPLGVDMIKKSTEYQRARIA